MPLKDGLESGTMVTYRMADGSLVWSEYDLVWDEEFFEEVDEPIDVTVETWVRVSTKTVTYGKIETDETHTEGDTTYAS